MNYCAFSELEVPQKRSEMVSPTLRLLIVRPLGLLEEHKVEELLSNSVILAYCRQAKFKIRI